MTRSLSRNDLIPIGEMARRSGLTVSAIRFYEDKGLIEPVRTSGNQRRSLRSDIRRVSSILIAQQLGLSLEEVGHELGKLPHGRTSDTCDWQTISGSIRAVLDRKIAQLQSVRDRLDGCIGCGCLSLKRCAIYNPDDRMAKLVAGPCYVLDPLATIAETQT
jgi:MerR family redox-sensitive transcriptional activator SoxR